jgi:formamidopyrimidine-DNA glycosylase
MRIWQQRLESEEADRTLRRLSGRTFSAINRRGKYLLFDVGEGKALMIHLGMTGSIDLSHPTAEPEKHAFLGISLDDGRELRLSDPRGFGEARFLADHELLSLDRRLGPEPLSEDFSLDYCTAEFGKRSGVIKGLLLNQSIVAGLGNIYVDEALWRAQIHPQRRANTLAQHEVKALRCAVIRVVTDAIEHRGTTFSDYRDLYGRSGDNGPRLSVFHRAAEPCPRCGGPIEFIRVSGRGTSLCPNCQSK